MLFLEYSTAFCLIFIKVISGQGLACYTCMTTDPNNDACQDPFSSILNTIQNNCQVEWTFFSLFFSSFNSTPVVFFSYRLHPKAKMAHFPLDSVWRLVDVLPVLMMVQMLPIEILTSTIVHVSWITLWNLRNLWKHPAIFVWKVIIPCPVRFVYKAICHFVHLMDVIMHIH